MKSIHVLGILVILLLISACGQPSAPANPVQAAPTCTDGIQNQGEQAIDCGGPCSACQSCTDKIQNQGETAVDCGGPCQACSSCNDGMKNQDETSVDCGGSCSPCAVPPKQVSYEVSSEDKALVQERMTGYTEAAFAKTTAMNMKVGDSFVFALGVKNTKLYKTKFKAAVVFTGAKDNYNNPIATVDREFDSSYINQWFGKTDFTREIELEPNAVGIIPIVVTVQDMYTAGKTTKQGSYSFNALVSVWDEFQFWDDYSTKMFTVNIA